MRNKLMCALAALALTVLTAVSPLTAKAAGGLELYTDYPGISVKAGDSQSISMYVSNDSGSAVEASLSILSMPEGWEGYFSGNGSQISRVHVQNGAEASLTFQLQIPEDAAEGSYTVQLQAVTDTGLTDTIDLVFDIQAASESTDTTYVAAAFLPTAGSSTIFVDQIAPGATKDISMEMEARADLSQKPYVVNVKMNYEDENVNAYENTASVSIPVRQEARIDTSSIEVMPESIEVGSEANVMFSIYNIGKTQLYNTTVKFIGDSITGGETYLGNIAPGATGNVDAYLSGAAATMDDGVIKIEITFEDEAGEATTVEKEMNLFVTEPYYPEMDMDMMADPMADQGGGFKIWYVLVPLALIIAAAAVIVVILKKKKKKAQAAQELADLDEELDDLEDVDISLDEEDTGAESSETEAPDTEASEEETAEGSEEKE